MICWDCNEPMVPAVRWATDNSAAQAYWLCACGRFQPVTALGGLGFWVAAGSALARMCHAPVVLPSGVLDTTGVVQDVPAAMGAMLAGIKMEQMR